MEITWTVRVPPSPSPDGPALLTLSAGSPFAPYMPEAPRLLSALDMQGPDRSVV